MENINFKYDVFISYSSNDKIIADGVLNYLEKNKIRCFIAYRDIPKGHDWAKFIPQALRSSRLMLAIFSKDFNDSEQTDNEISIAAKRHIPMLVFRITDDDFNGSKEYFLTKSNWIEAFPEPEKQFGDLYNNICILLNIKNVTETVKQEESIVTCDSQAPGDELIRKGKKIFYSEDGDKEMAVFYFKKAAKMGNATGEYLVGYAYFYGCGMENSWKNAIKHYSLAAEHGNTEAMVELAKMYRYGIGMERNSMKAMEWYIKAADNGNGKAMKELGSVFKTGELGITDEERSGKYYEHAFEALYDKALGENDPAAQHALGNSYMDGEGVKRSYSQAVRWYQRAIKNNYPPAFNTLALCYGCGMGVDKDEKKEFELKMMSAKLGFPLGMSNLSLNYFNGCGVEKNEKEYKKWRNRAAECGDPSAQINVGADYYIGETEEKDLDKARKWFERAIKSGSYKAANCLGIMYENNDIEDTNGMEKAFCLYRRAAIGGNVDSMKCLATCYYYGNGTETDKAKAAYWYEKMAVIYENMVANDDDYYITKEGAGTVSNIDFDKYNSEMFAECFENLAEIYKNGYGKIEADSLKAEKWQKVSMMLKGEVENVEQNNNIKELENAAKKNNVDALDRLLTIYEENGNKAKIKQWANYAIENTILINKRDLMVGIDHVGLVLGNNDIDNHKKVIEYLKAMFESAKDGGNYRNCHSLYNAICCEYKKKNIDLSEDDINFIRNDANDLTENSFIGYLRNRKEHYDILFPEYNPERILHGDFSNQRDMLLFYAENTDNDADYSMSNLGINKMFKPLYNDKSYSTIVKSQNGHFVNCGEAGKAINEFVSSYNILCKKHSKITKVQIDDYSFDMLVPIAMPEQMQRWSIQLMQALISARSLFNDKWDELVSKLNNLDALLDIAEVLQDENLQLMLIEYVEYSFEYGNFCKYTQRLQIIYLDSKKQALADELNAYVKRLEDNGISHNLPKFTIDNIPQNAFSDAKDDASENSKDGQTDNDTDDDFEKLLANFINDDEQNLSAEDMYKRGDDYYNGVNGKPQDYVQATKWFKMASDMGYALAQNDMGVCLSRGIGVEKDLNEAFNMYRKAAEQGFYIAQYNLGYCYYSGDGCERNYYMAVDMLQKAALQNHPKAMSLLGDCYYYGNGVNTDYVMAKKWYEKAAAFNDESSKDMLRTIEENEKLPQHLHTVEVNGLTGFANNSNEIVIDCQWDKANNFIDDVALVWKGNKMGAINNKGEYYCNCEKKCNEATYLGHGLIKIYDNVLYEVYKLSGKDTFGTYAEIGDKFEDGYVKAIKYRIFGKNRKGKIDKNGNFIEDEDWFVQHS